MCGSGAHQLFPPAAPCNTKISAAHDGESDAIVRALDQNHTDARRFHAETGVAPLQWLLTQRVDAARTALEAGDATIDEIAHRCGFGTAANLRKHFRRVVDTTPTAYRRAFSVA